MANLYTDIDSYCCHWLSNLVDAGELPQATVQHADIRQLELDPGTFDQIHLFAGIGGWPLALQMAGVPESASTLTGSCPCQPFSTAGQRKGQDDDRHLWPEMLRIIRYTRPAIVFGEQVDGPDGRLWLSGVHDQLDGAGYRVVCASLPACSVGAPHRRQRLFWMGVSLRQRREVDRILRSQTRCHRETSPQVAWDGTASVPDGSTNGKRRIKPGLEPLAHGVPKRMEQLRAYGNAIVPHVAAEFIRASLGAIGDYING